MAIWFTSDHHFGHENIMKFCGRPFRDTAEMDERMIEAWNAVVGDADEVWHLGDFACRCGPRRMAEIFARLNGCRRHLVVGNHDKKHAQELPWTSVQKYCEIKVESANVVLFHYALREWNRAQDGAWALFGHSHGRLSPLGRSCDVGVDCWNFRPVSFEQIVSTRQSSCVKL